MMQKQTYAKVFHNAKWIILCRVVQSLLQLVVGMLCARYLGPGDYGLIGYAASLLTFALPLMRLGLNATLVKELVEEPEQEGQIMGTALVLNLLAALAAMAGVYAFATAVNPGDPRTVLVCTLYSLSLIFSAMEMFQYWFQYRLMSGYSAAVMLAAYVAASAYRIFLLARSADVWWFALTNSVDQGIIGVTLILIYHRLGGRLSFCFKRAAALLAGSRYYLLSALVAVLFQSTDRILLTAMAGTAENGFYCAAVTCATMAQFVFLAITDSFRPVILEAHRDDPVKFGTDVARLYAITFYLSLAQALVLTVGAGWIIALLYGGAYLRAVPVLRVLGWQFVFSCMGVVRNVWILAENRQKYLWRINLLGAMVSIGVNLYMIPRWGALGAAITSLLTQFVMNFLLGFPVKSLRGNNLLMLRGMDPRFAGAQGRMLVAWLRGRIRREENGENGTKQNGIS